MDTSKLARIIALVLVGVTFCLLIAGGLVHSTGSSLACPDWPLCFGTAFPKMTGGVEFEHTHRLIAGSVALLTLALCIVLWRQRRQGVRQYTLAFAALGIVLFQAVLGGLTVIYKLPPMISTAHLATSMIFFSMIITLCWRLHAQSLGEVTPDAAARLGRMRSLFGFSALMVYSQIVLGALVRHTGAGSVCTTIPLCENSLWPMQAHPAIRLHMAHRLWGVATAVVVMIAALRSLRAGLLLDLKSPTKRGMFFRAAGFLLPLLVIGQIGLGVLSVVTLLGIAPVTAHLGVGALILGLSVSLWHLSRSAGSQTMNLSLGGDLASLAKVRLTSMVLIVMIVGYFVAPEARVLPLSHFMHALGSVAILVLGAAFLNAYLERDNDAQMIRTRERPLPAKRLQPAPVLYAGLFLGLLGVCWATFYVNPLTGLLGAVAYISYAFLYTPMKAKTSFAALVGAVPGALPPLLGWTSATGRVGAIGATLFFILFFWQLPHFFAIAFYRMEEYRNAGTQVMPLAQGEALTKKLMARYAAMLVPVTLFLVPLGIAGRIYFAVALALGLIYFIWTCYGFFRPASKAWARGLFVYSLVYLPVLFITLLFDSKLP